MKTVLLAADILIEVLRQRDEAILEDWRRLARNAELVLYAPATMAELWHALRQGEEAAVSRILESGNLSAPFSPQSWVGHLAMR